MLQHSRFMRFKTSILPLHAVLHSWAAINRVVLIEEKETKQKYQKQNKTKQKTTPPSRQHRLKVIALIRCGQDEQEACQVYTLLRQPTTQGQR